MAGSAPLARHRRTATIRAAVTALAGAALLLVGCGGDGGGDDGGGTKPTTAGPPSPVPAISVPTTAPGPVNAADVAFAQQVIPHHEEAAAMASLAATRAANPTVKKLASRFNQTQEAEVKAVRAWLRQWHRPESAGRAHTSDVQRLAGLRGAAFDREFVKLIVESHQGAIEMAKDEQEKGHNATAQQFASAIIVTQSLETDTLHSISDRL